MPRQLGPVQRLLEAVDADLAEQGVTNVGTSEGGKLQQGLGEGDVLFRPLANLLDSLAQKGYRRLRVALQRVHSLACGSDVVQGLLNRLHRLPGSLQAEGFGIGSGQALRQRSSGIDGGANIPPAECLLQRLARRIGPGQHAFCLLYGSQLIRIQNELPDGIHRRQREERNLELIGPLLDCTVDLGRKSLAGGWACRRLAVSAEPHSAQGEVLNDDLLFGQCRGIELEPDRIGLEEIPSQHKWVGDLQRPELHRRLPGEQVELAQVDFCSQQLGAGFLGGVPRHRLGENPDHNPEQEKEKKQGPDGLPAKHLELHGRNILYRLYTCEAVTAL